MPSPTLAALTALALCAAACTRAQPPARADAASAADRALADRPPQDADPLREPADDASAPDATVSAEPPRVTITATGDITVHPRLVAMADAHREDGRLAWFFPTLAPIITPREVALAFLETPLSAVHRPVSIPRGVLGASPALARDIARLGFDALSLATEHGYDQTGAGLAETRDAVVHAGMGAVGVGAGEQEPWVAWRIERDGFRVAVVAATARIEQEAGDDPGDVRLARLRDSNEPLLAAVRAARGASAAAGDASDADDAGATDESGDAASAVATADASTERGAGGDGGGAAAADVVVAMVHWGRDFSPGVDAERRALARALVDAGADVVLGAGPNVLHPVERLASPRGDAVVAYSLGNLLSNQGSLWRPDRTPPSPELARSSGYNDAAREGAVLRVTFERREGRLALKYLTAVALWTRQREDEVRVLPLRAMDEPFRSQRLALIQRRLGPAVRVRP